MKPYLLHRVLIAVLILNFGFAVSHSSVVVAQKLIMDDVIANQVKIRLAGDSVVKGGALQVEVTQGVVTLSGVVETEKVKIRAEKLTKKVKYVKAVVNNLTVKSH